MELPDLLQLASKKVTLASPQNAGTFGGSYLTKLKGRGMEFAEARPYLCQGLINCFVRVTAIHKARLPHWRRFNRVKEVINEITEYH